MYNPFANRRLTADEARLSAGRRALKIRVDAAWGRSLIARLSGTLAETSSDSAVIDVGGVGYLVHLSTRALDALGPVGGQVLLLTELQVREDAWTLFGFASQAERDAFRTLTSVQGVGGRLALAILSVLPPDELARAVAQEDKAMIGRANGVGPKLAARIANELQGKLGVAAIGGSAPAPRGNEARDALSALANLGFKPADASAAVNAAQDELGNEATLDALVRLALKKAAK
jgi:Holliday junction DNA helicase RuvA